MKTMSKFSTINIFYTLLASLVAICGLIFFGLYFREQYMYNKTNDAQVDAYINPVSARAGGFIKKVCYEEHQLVKAGDTLVILEDQEYRQKLKEAEAFLDDSKAQVVVLDAGISAAQTGTMVNRDQISGARARLNQQESDMKRYKNLIREEAVTQSDLESVQAKYEVSLSDFHGAQSAFKTSLSKIEELRSRRALLEADIKKKAAQLELARLNFGYTVIRAPYSGRMGRKTILEGQQIQPGQPLVSIVNEQQKWITANFKETQIQDMKVGQKAIIQIDAISDRRYTGRVVAISGSTGAKFSLLPVDNSTGNFVKIIQRVPVKIAFSDANLPEVKPGMNVTVSVYKN